MAAAHEPASAVAISESDQPGPAPRPWVVGQRAIPAVSNVARCDVAPQAASVKRARDFAAEALRRWSLDRLGDTVELLVSELVTNALRHGLTERAEKTTVAGSLGHPRSPVELILACESPHLMCIVTDPGDDVPVLGDPADLEENGRGLHVVASCCRSWGWARFAAGGKAVWAMLHYQPPGRSG